MAEKKIQIKKIQKRTIESREKINGAAWTLFSEKGYFNTNTKDIAKLAGVSIGNFYNYYKDKFDVYYELSTQYLQGSVSAVANLEDAMMSAKNQRTALKEYIDEQMERAIGTARFFSDCQVLVRDNDNLRQLFMGETEKVVNTIEALLIKIPGIKQRAAYPVMARLLYTMINNLADDACSPTNISIYEEYKNQMTEIVQNYVFGEQLSVKNSDT